MKRTRFLIISALVLSTALIVLLLPLGPTEPVYQGKRLGAWLEGMHSNPVYGERAAREAVQALGTNALPYLLFEFERIEPKWKKRLFGSNLLGRTLNLVSEPDSVRHIRATEGLIMLGSNAAPAMPSMFRYLGDLERRELAVAVMSQTGQPGIPYLINALSSTNTVTVSNVLMRLWDIMPEAAPALPSIIRLLDHPEPSIRRQAIAVLAAQTSRPNSIVPALRKALSDSDTKVRRKAVSGLTSFEEAARPAVPDLMRLLKDPDPQVASSARYSLERIDPTALQRAEASNDLRP